MKILPRNRSLRITVIIGAVILFLGVGAVGARHVLIPFLKTWREKRANDVARDYLQKGDYPNAILAVRKTLSYNQNNIDAWKLAVEITEKQNVPDVVFYQQHLAGLNPTFENRLKAIQVAVKYHAYREAETLIAQIGQEGAKSPEFLDLAATVSRRSGNPTKAKYYLMSLVSLQPNNTKARFELAQLRLVEGSAENKPSIRAEIRTLASDPEYRARALALRDGYAKASPYPHAVVDGFLGSDLARELAAAFPGLDHAGWKRRDHPEQAARLGQLQRQAFEGVDPRIRHLLNELSGMLFIDFLETLTGVQGLIADPHFRGAGLHLTLSGGHLDLHADFNRDRFRGVTRRVSVLYYLNPAWEPAWGGELELWNKELTRCEEKFAPVLDRLMVIAHGDTHWHGHPHPLNCPQGSGRAAVAAYFYTAAAEAQSDAPAAHSAIWVKPQSA